MSSLRNNNSRLSNSRNLKGSSVNLNNTSKIKASTEFSNKLQNLQKQTEDNIEDEYIKNLQQQIAYMELELKLLKEKDIDQKESTSQIDKFFNDGVPLNENILALKNQYNATKKEFQQKIEELNDDKLDEQRYNIELKNEYQFLVNRLAEIEKIIDQKDIEHIKTMDQFKIDYINERTAKKEKEAALKKLQEELKTKNDQNLNMTRKLEREGLLIAHNKEQLKIHQDKQSQRLKDKAAIIVKLTIEVNELRNKCSFNPDVPRLENENLDLQAKIIQCERESNISITKIKEMEMNLEILARDRQIKSEEKRDLQQKILIVKNKIEDESKVNELVIQDRVKQREEKEKKELEKQLLLKRKEKHMAEDQKENIERTLENIIQEKVELQQDTLDHDQNIGRLMKETQELKQKSAWLKTQIEHLEKTNVELDLRMKPVNEENSKMEKIIQLLLPQIQKLKENIDALLQQEQLAQELKNVNLEGLKELHKSNDQVFQTLQDLTKKWEQIQRSSQK